MKNKKINLEKYNEVKRFYKILTHLYVLPTYIYLNELLFNYQDTSENTNQGSKQSVGLSCPR